MLSIFLVADIMEGIRVCAGRESLTLALAAGDDGSSAVQGHTPMIRSETGASCILRHTELPLGGHSHSWYPQEIIKVP